MSKIGDWVKHFDLLIRQQSFVKTPFDLDSLDAATKRCIPFFVDSHRIREDSKQMVIYMLYQVASGNKAELRLSALGNRKSELRLICRGESREYINNVVMARYFSNLERDGIWRWNDVSEVPQ